MLISLILIATGVIGMVTFIFILFGYKTNEIMNIYLALIILLSSYRLALVGVLGLSGETLLHHSFLKNYNIVFVFLISFIYLYFKNLINNQKKIVVQDLFHFIIPILFILINCYTNTLKNFNRNHHSLLYSLFIIYVVFYNILTFKKLKKNIWHKKSILQLIEKQNKIISKWSFYLYITLNFIGLRLLISMFLEKKQLGIFVGVYGIYLSSIVWCLIYFKILYTPEILYGYKFLRKKSKENKDYIIIKTFQWQLKKNYEINNNQELQLRDKIIKNIENYVTEIELVIDENQFFRDPNFTLNELAFKLNIPKSHLLYLFKYHSKISFLDLKKTIRIQDAVILINNGYLKKNTYDSLAKKVGFLSYNPFFTSFKDIVGISPNKYNSNTTTISKKIS
tara:strand:+ start:1192 stop:2373 length:1182 start_codon:yes stop_codon:yes gene_type:complete